MSLLFLRIKIALYTLSYAFYIPKFYLLKSKDKEYRKKYLYDNYVKTWSNKIINFLNIDLEIVGIENIPKTPVVIVSNHQDGSDIPILFKALTNNPAFIAKKELNKIPVFSFWMKALGCILLDRSSPYKALESFKIAATKIKEGQNIIIFPEGTRRKELLPFKKGSFKLAIMAEVDILPVTIIGSDLTVENYLNSKRTKVKVIIDKPVKTAGVSKDALKKIDEEVFEIIKNNHNSLT